MIASLCHSGDRPGLFRLALQFQNVQLDFCRCEYLHQYSLDSELVRFVWMLPLHMGTRHPGSISEKNKTGRYDVQREILWIYLLAEWMQLGATALLAEP